MTQPPNHFWDFMEDGDFDKFAAKETKVHQGWCPECGSIAVSYPDGRLTCLRCEWEDPLIPASGQELPLSSEDSA